MKTDFQKLAADLTNDAFGDISVNVILRKVTSEEYDVSMGGMVQSTTDYPFKAFLGAFSRDLLNSNDILLTDTRCWFPFISVPNGVVPIAQSDLIIGPDGTQYDIISLIKDTAEAGYTLQLRITNE